MQNISSQLGAMSAATARLITLATITSENGAEDEDEVDFATIGTAVATIGTHISHLMEDVKTVSLLEEQGDENLLEAARQLADAFTGERGEGLLKNQLAKPVFLHCFPLEATRYLSAP